MKLVQKMLSESFVTAIMEVSITGAGLVLAILALVAPLSRKINEINVPEENIEKVKNLLLGVGISLAITFLFYMLSLFMAYGWFLGDPLSQALYEILLKIFFLVSNATFMVFGFSVLTLIYTLMERELR
jgi:hypothetical protein